MRLSFSCNASCSAKFDGAGMSVDADDVSKLQTPNIPSHSVMS